MTATVVTGDGLHTTAVSDNLGYTPPTTDIHAFKIDANGDMQWYHGSDVTELQDEAQEDKYDLIIVGSTDQVFSIDDDGYLKVSFT